MNFKKNNAVIYIDNIPFNLDNIAVKNFDGMELAPIELDEKIDFFPFVVPTITARCSILYRLRLLLKTLRFVFSGK